MAFIPQFRWISQKKQEEKWWNSWEKVEQRGRWPQQACTTMFFLIPEERHQREANCVATYDYSLVGSSLCTRGVEMAKRKISN